MCETTPHAGDGGVGSMPDSTNEESGVPKVDASFQTRRHESQALKVARKDVALHPEAILPTTYDKAMVRKKMRLTTACVQYVCVFSRTCLRSSKPPSLRGRQV